VMEANDTGGGWLSNEAGDRSRNGGCAASLWLRRRFPPPAYGFTGVSGFACPCTGRKVQLGPRESAKFLDLVHPVHASGREIGAEPVRYLA